MDVLCTSLSNSIETRIGETSHLLDTIDKNS